MLKKGQVIKEVGGRFTVESDNINYICSARGKIKLNDEIYVGDYVEFLENGKNNIIEHILPRKNKIIRPYISNIDILLIFIAPTPRADLILVDKLIINCVQENIKPILVVNKIDLDYNFYESIKDEYKNILQVYGISAKEKTNLEELLAVLKNSLVAFSGQSAVGKSSVINAMFSTDLKVGEISLKLERGKHCTRHIEIFNMDGYKIADTCGFSMFEFDIDPHSLKEYYYDFDEFYNCKYSSCNHISEPDCGIINAVNNGSFNKNRYSRYVQIYNELKEKQYKKY